MSSVDFKQEAKHHGFIHIAVKDLGEEPDSFFGNVLKALAELPPIQLVEPKGTVLFLRFLNSLELPPWALGGLKWSDFCAHKQILGVLGVSKCYDLDDLDNVLAGFKLYTANFKSSLCQSRCFIYGSKTELEGGNIDPKKGHRLIDCNTVNRTTDGIKSDVLTKEINDFARSIYDTLINEISDLEKCLEIGGSPVKFLRSPFESKDASRSEDDQGSDTRSVVTQSKARMEKHVADLSLLVGDHWKAFRLYKKAKQSSSKQTQNIWYAAINEGLAVTRIIINLCEEVLGQKAQGLIPSSQSTQNLNRKLGGSSRTLARPSSQSGGSLSSPRPLVGHDNRHTPPSNSDLVRISKFATIRRPQTSAEGDTSSERPNGGLAFKHLDIVKQQDPLSSSGGTGSDEEGSGVEEDNYDEEDGENWLQVDRAMLRKDFIVDRYRDALKVYGKAKLHEAMAYIEALLKFSKYLVDQKRYLMASEQLQRMVRIDIDSFITDSDKLQLYCTIAEAYQSMGFHRKAALFTHYAARWASSFAQSPDQVLKAYDLIVSCLSGYKLSQNLSKLLKKEEGAYSGWPVLQAQVLKDLVFLSRRKEENDLTISHSCYLLQYLAEFLSPGDIHEITTMLGQIAEEQSENAQTSTALCSPLPLENFPSVKSVHLIELVDLLKPIKIEGFVPPAPKETPAASTNSPFIFSPFEANRRKGKKRPEVLWVVGNPGEVLMIVENTLPFDLRVTNMLIQVEAEGSEVVTIPASLTLPVKSEPQDIKLLTVPSQPGLLDIKGYEANVFGVRHECKVKIPGDPIVRVVAPLPEICLRLFPALPASEECPLSPSLRVSKAYIPELELLDGETFKCEFHIECLSKGELAVDVEQVTVSVADYDKDYCDISWDDSTVKAMLPLSKGHSGSFIVSIRGKIPDWFRVLNEYTQGISKTTVFPDLKYEPRQSFSSSSHHSHSANTTPNESPTSSPIPKRLSLPRSKNKRASEQSCGSDFSFSKESSLMDSLNLENPALTSARTSSTLPGISRSPGHQRNTSIGSGGTLGRWKPASRGSKKVVSKDETDLELDKRFSVMSIRSDPGDEVRNRTKRKSSEQPKAIPIPKSETRASPFGTSPQLYHHDLSSVSSSQSHSSLNRTPSGNKAGTRVRQQAAVLTKGSISTPVGPLIRQKPQPPTRRVVQSQFKIQYTGGRGYLEGFCRKCSASLKIVVKPCLVFEKFEILSDQQFRDVFNLKFSVHNTSKSKVEASVSVEQDSKDKGDISVDLDPNGLQELKLPIKRFVLPVSDQENDDSSSLVKLYSERVSKMVKVHWKDLENDKVGVVSLSGLRLPVSAVSLVKPIPLIFGSSLDDQPESLALDHNWECGVGDKVKLTLKLTNTSGIRMPPSFLIFEPSSHSQQQKTFHKDLSHMLLYTGSLIVNVPQLDPDKSYEHKLTWVFLLKGDYRVEMKSYMQLEGMPTFQVKIPNTGSPVEVKTESESSATTESTCEPEPSTEPAMPPNHSPSQKNEVDCPQSSSSLSSDCDQNRPFSPPSNSASPRRSPVFSRNTSSPDTSATKTKSLVHKYEANLTARDAIVYKEPALTSKKKLSTGSSLERAPSFEKVTTDSIEKNVSELTQDTPSSPSISTPLQTGYEEVDLVRTAHLLPTKQLERAKVDYDGISTLLSEFVSEDSLPRSSTASPIEVSSKNPTPPPLPRGYHGTLKSANVAPEKSVSESKQDSFNRFQRLRKLRAQNSKAVQVISGPLFVFSVS